MLGEKVCLVTGSNRGIGAAIIEKFAKEGAIVYANARDEGSIDVLCEKLNYEYGSKVIPVYFDVTDEKAVREVFMRIKKERQRIDVLVNNAGIMKDALIGMVSKSLMKEVFNVNVFAVMNMLQMAAKLMKRQGGGSIINMASIVGTNGSAGQSVYSASKGAVISLTKSAAKELAGHNIRVNAVAPGIIDTDMIKHLGQEKLKDNIANIGYGRLGNVEEVANACAFLASDMSEYITGQIIGVDGGMVI